MGKLDDILRFCAKLFGSSENAEGVIDANSVDNIVHDRRNYRGGVHPFATGYEQAVADLGRVRVLEKAVSDESVRTLQHGEGTSVRSLTNVLVSAAKAAGCYIAYGDREKFGDMKRRRSGESEIFVGTDFSKIVKFKNPEAKQPLKQTTPTDWLLEHVIHNVLFPDTRYEFLGISEFSGSPRIVLEQKNVNSVAFSTDQAIASELRGMGLLPLERYSFGNEVLSVLDVGARGDNVLLGEDGHLYFIDPLIRLKRTAIDVLSWMVGDIGDNF